VWRSALALLAVLAGAAALVAAPAQAARPSAEQRAARYLERAQNRDGGLGAMPRSGSAALTTIWSALGLAAADRAPATIRRRGGRSLRDAVVAAAAQARQTGEVERAVLALRASRAPVPVELVARLVERIRPDGSFDGMSTLTAFGILALRAADRPADDPAVQAATHFVLAQQNPDGGFHFAGLGGISFVDDTAAAIQALIAGGLPATAPEVQRTLAFLAARQRRDGGFPLAPTGTSNAQSTAWAVQAFVAAGVDPRRVRRDGARSPLAYLRALQARDGSIRYSRTSRQTPVWVTAQALTALAREPFPLLP
jgi:prenyltransferase beta subunit